ncbi:MAG: hypothetical protein K2N12_08390 [Helicobacter sp.]|nr:hypothetical protein [Helicobacter sp.]
MLVGYIIALGLVFCKSFFYPQPQIHSLRLSQLEDLPPIEVGDVIFREGIGMDSAIIQKLSNHRYTHIGIIISNDPIIILHASTDSCAHHAESVVLNTFEEFLQCSQNIAIKRFRLSADVLQNVINRAYQRLGDAFVLSRNHQRLYCTTLLEDALEPFVALNLSYTNVEFPVLGGEYLFPKAFFEDSHSVLIYESNVAW